MIDPGLDSRYDPRMDPRYAASNAGKSGRDIPTIYPLNGSLPSGGYPPYPYPYDGGSTTANRTTTTRICLPAYNGNLPPHFPQHHPGMQNKIYKKKRKRE